VRISRYIFLLISSNPKVTSSVRIHPANLSSTIPQSLPTFPLMWHPAKPLPVVAVSMQPPAFSSLYSLLSLRSSEPIFNARCTMVCRIGAAYAYYRICFVSRIIPDSHGRGGAFPAALVPLVMFFLLPPSPFRRSPALHSRPAISRISLESRAYEGSADEAGVAEAGRLRCSEYQSTSGLWPPSHRSFLERRFGL